MKPFFLGYLGRDGLTAYGKVVPKQIVVLQLNPEGKVPANSDNSFWHKPDFQANTERAATFSGGLPSMVTCHG